MGETQVLLIPLTRCSVIASLQNHTKIDGFSSWKHSEKGSRKDQKSVKNLSKINQLSATKSPIALNIIVETLWKAVKLSPTVIDQSDLLGAQASDQSIDIVDSASIPPRSDGLQLVCSLTIALLLYEGEPANACDPPPPVVPVSRLYCQISTSSTTITSTL